jgi:hypothetical protein
MATFGVTSREICSGNRKIANTPLQALVMLNDPTFMEAAIAVAVRASKSHSETPEQAIGWIWNQVVLRPLEPVDAEHLLGLYRDLRAEYAASPDDARKLLNQGMAAIPKIEVSPELAALSLVASVIFNFDGALYR